MYNLVFFFLEQKAKLRTINTPHIHVHVHSSRCTCKCTCMYTWFYTFMMACELRAYHKYCRTCTCIAHVHVSEANIRGITHVHVYELHVQGHLHPVGLAVKFFH